MPDQVEVVEITYRKPETEHQRWSRKNPRKARHLKWIMSDEYLQAKIRKATENLKRMGYTEESAKDVLNHVAALVAKGE